jgi:hypothetical protein
MADRIVAMYPAPSGTQFIYLKKEVDFSDNWSWGNAFNLTECYFIALVEKGKEQRVTGLELNPETGNLEIPTGNDFLGLLMPTEDTFGQQEVFEAYYEVAKERQK